MIYWLDLFGVGIVAVTVALALRLMAARRRLELPMFSLAKSD